LTVGEAETPALIRQTYSVNGATREGTFLPVRSTLLATYAFFMKLVFFAGNLYALCRVAGCTSGVKAGTPGMRLTYQDDKGKMVIKMKNFADHLLSPRCPHILTYDDFKRGCFVSEATMLLSPWLSTRMVPSLRNSK
jgi:hypothetical protein